MCYSEILQYCMCRQARAVQRNQADDRRRCCSYFDRYLPTTMSHKRYVFLFFKKEQFFFNRLSQKCSSGMQRRKVSSWVNRCCVFGVTNILFSLFYLSRYCTRECCDGDKEKHGQCCPILNPHVSVYM